MTLQIGERFAVKQAQEVKNDRGRLLARYLPEFTYCVTERNVGIVRQMEADGVALPAAGGVSAGLGEGLKLTASPSKATGRVSTKKKGSK